GPFAMRFQVNFEMKSSFVNLSGCAGRNLGFADEALPLVTENEPISFDSPVEFAGAIEFLVFHLKQISKIGIRFNPHLQVDWLGFVIHNLDVFVKSSANRALAHD